MKRLLLPLFLLAASSLFASSVSYPVTYIWHNGIVATAPYYTSDGAYFEPATINSINDSGNVAGDTIGAQWQRSAATWNGVTSTTLDSLPGYAQSFANGINNAGDLVGESYNDGLTMEPTEWIGAQPIDLGLASGFSHGQVDAINNSGESVGTEFTQSGLEAATLWANGNATTLSAPSGYSEAIAINDSGVIVGGFNSQPVAWINGIMSALPCSAGGNAYDINDSGLAVGICGNDAVLWDVATGKMTDLGPGLAQGINDAGVVVGSTGSNSYDPTTQQTFIWSADGGMQILPGFAWSEPFAINDAGSILGFGELLADPNSGSGSDVPEPGTFALTGLAALMALFFRRIW